MYRDLPTHLLYLAVTGESVAPGDHVCLLCGCSCDLPVSMQSVIRDTFTNHSMCRAPSSRDVCRACDHYFNHRWRPEGAKKPAEYRLLSFKIEGCAAPTFAPWPRENMRRDIEGWLEGACPGGVFVVSLAKKKHLLPLARVNPEQSRDLVVQLEEGRVRCSPGIWRACAAAFDSLLALGVGKGEIITGEYSTYSIRKVGMARIAPFDKVLVPQRGGLLLTLISYATIIKSEDEA